MSHHKRQSRIKSRPSEDGKKLKRNVNPKLNASQREKKRARLANQPPIEIKGQRDFPSRAREQAAYIHEQRAKRLERRAKFLSDRNERDQQAAGGGGAEQHQRAVTSAISAAQAARESASRGALFKSATSINSMIAADVDMDGAGGGGGGGLGGRVRLNLLERKAKLRLKKKLRRRSKREEITNRTLSDLMGRDAEETRIHNMFKGKGGKAAAAVAAATARREMAEREKHTTGALTRKERKSLQSTKARQDDAERRRQKRLASNDDDDMEVERFDDDDRANAKSIGHQAATSQKLQMTAPDAANNKAAGSSGSSNKKNDANVLSSSSAAAAAAGAAAAATIMKRKKKVRDMTEGGRDWELARQREHREQQRKEKGKFRDFTDMERIDYVGHNDRVDAPPILDVVPSAALADAMLRRTAKMRGGAGATDADAAGGRRVAQLSAHSTLSEQALRKMRQTGTAVSFLDQLKQREQHPGNGASSSSSSAAAPAKNSHLAPGGMDNLHFDRKVSGSNLQSAADFAAYREQVMANYAKKHPTSFGKTRTYRPV